MGEKFFELQNYIKKSNQERLTMTFIEIENVLGFKLCSSARKHVEYWANTTSHSIAYS